jgi:hypothetical protein
VVTASPHAHTGVPTGSPYQSDWADTGSNRECTMLGLGNIESGPDNNPNLFPTDREDGTTAFPFSIDNGNEIRVARYPTTFKITATWPTITADDVLVDHSTGISKTRSSARIHTGGSITWGVRYDELLTGQDLHGEFSGRFIYSTRSGGSVPQDNPLIDFDETRNGGNDDQASQSLNASRPLTRLFITGSDNLLTATGTTTNDITLGANVNDFTGKTFQADYQNTITDDTSGGTFQVRVRASESLFPSNSNSNVNIQRKWEALEIVINGSDSDHTLPPFATTSTLTPLAGLLIPGEATVSTSTTMTATGVVKRFGDATLATTTTVVTEPGQKFIITSTELPTFTVTTDVLAALTPQVFGSASFGSAFSTTTLGGNVHGPTLEMSTVTTMPTAQGNLIFDITGDYTWDSFNLNSYFETGFAVDNFSLNQGEYSWDFLATTAWDDWPVATWLGDEETWDNWPNDVWETPFTVDTTTAITTAIPLFKPGGIATLSTTASVVPLGAFSISAASTIPVAFNVEVSAPGIFDTTALLANTFALTVSDIDYLENITSDEIEIFASSFSATITANVKTDTTVDIDTALNFAFAIGNVVFDITDSTPSQFSVDVTGNTKTDTSLILNALAATINVGRLVEQADPFNIVKIIPETRTIVMPVENRILEVDTENRVNIISAETSQVEVSQETRIVKLKRQPITARFSTPRIRSKA